MSQNRYLCVLMVDNKILTAENNLKIGYMKRFKMTFAMALLFAVSISASSCSKKVYDGDNGNFISISGMKNSLDISDNITMMSGMTDEGWIEKDGSPIISRNFNFKNFHGIDVDNAADIVYIQGKDYSIVAKGKQTLVNNLNLEVNKGILNISNKKNVRKNKEHSITITITAPSLDDIEIGGVCTFTADKLTGKNIDMRIDGVATLNIKDITCTNIKESFDGVVKHNGKVNADYFELDIDGVAKFETTFEGGTLDLDCDGVGTVDIQVDCKKLTANSDGVVKVTLSGTADDTTIKSSGVSKINTKNLNNF